MTFVTHVVPKALVTLFDVSCLIFRLHVKSASKLHNCHPRVTLTFFSVTGPHALLQAEDDLRNSGQETSVMLVDLL